jgi:hypothetical protein
MILSTSFLNKVRIIIASSLFCLAGCANSPEVIPTAKTTLQNRDYRVAVFPVDNLTGAFVPVKDIRKAWVNKLEKNGLHIIDDELLENTLTKHRIRFIGGVDTATARAFREEAGTDAILITSLEYWSETFPPKIAMISRLVSTGERPKILWMDSVGMAGDDSPGILGIGLIRDFQTLQDKALQRLADSYSLWFNENQRNCGTGKVESKYQPKAYYSASPIDTKKKISIAVVPFYNESLRKRAGEIEQLHFNRLLNCAPNIDPVEPGIVREKMLGIRMIMREGVSIRDVDVLTYVLDADFVLSGTVFDYQDPQGGSGTPKIDFSALIINKGERKVVWLSKSYNRGDDGVFFYDVGRENNANVMAEKMVHSVVEIMSKAK